MLCVWPALRTYRAFVRPVLEYGLAIVALSPTQQKQLNKTQEECIKMALNRNTNKQFPTVIPMVLADLPSMQSRSQTLQLKFLVRLQSLPVTTMARAVELSFLWTTNQHDHWKKLCTNNPYLKLYKKLKNKQKQDKEYAN